MKNFLENLWYSQPWINPMEGSSEKSKLVELTRTNQTKLRTNLTQEQAETLDKYDACMGELRDLSEAEAFIKGARFAAMFLVGVLCEK